MTKSKGNSIKDNAHIDSAFFVYILRTSNNQLYIGHTNNLDRRELEHKHFHNGAKFIKDNGFQFKIVYTEKYQTRVEAMKREKQLKCWTRAKKEALIMGNLELLKNL